MASPAPGCGPSLLSLAGRGGPNRVVITRNGRPEAVIISVSDLETIEETLDLLSTPGAIDEIRTAEAEISRGEAIGADELRRLMAERFRNERDAG